MIEFHAEALQIRWWKAEVMTLSWPGGKLNVNSSKVNGFLTELELLVTRSLSEKKT